MGWAPILTGPSAESVRAALFDVADALGSEPFAHPSLVGAAGAAVLHWYLARAFPGARFAARGEALLDRAVEQAFDSPLGEGLFSGISGVGWALAHTHDGAGEPHPTDDEDDPNAELDQLLETALRGSPWPGHYDLISGLVGIGVYALERAPRPVALQCVDHVIERLAELARPSGDGLAWWTAPQHIVDGERRYPEGHFDVGTAHGVAGIIGWLGRASALPGVRARAKPLLDGGVRWLLQQRRAGEDLADFPSFAGDAKSNRTAWCYGAPGIAASLLVAARGAGEPAWERAAVDIALAAAESARVGPPVDEPGLCHGAAGLAHLFNRLYQASGDERLAVAAREWIERTLALRTAGAGIAGYRAYERTADRGFQWVATTNFLTGPPGIALVLLAAICEIEPAWDRVLVCS